MCLGFEIQILCFCVVNVLIKARLRKQVVSSLCYYCLDLNSNPGNFGGSTLIYLVWRIVFACHGVHVIGAT
jgi:hypothetical protein